jgi:predicted alpha/beta superfamily hydrolase
LIARLTPSYAGTRARYRVIYLHEGQNVYDEPAPQAASEPGKDLFRGLPRPTGFLA